MKMTASRKPIMVFAGSFWTGSSESGLSAGFRDLGWLVQEVDQRDFGVQAGADLLLRAAARLTRRMTGEAYRQKLLDACRALKPDVFLTIKGVGVTAELLQKVKDMGARTIMYYPDFHFEHPGVAVDSFDEYDLFVTTKTFQVEHLTRRLGADRVAYVPHGYVAAVHQPLFETFAETNHQSDALYIGNHSDFKQQWLESLARHDDSLDLRIVGGRWRTRAASGPLADKDINDARTGLAYAREIQSARINIALHMGPTTSGWGDLVSTRSFEIPACRGFMLHIDNPEIRELFEPGVEIDVFATPEELADKIAFYLSRPELRARMIERAYARCVPAYSYNARSTAIQEAMQARLPLTAVAREEGAYQ